MKREITRRELQRLLDKWITPHATRIAEVGCAHGGLVVMVFEPGEDTQAWLRDRFEWRGAPVFAMSEEMRRELAQTDHVTQAWLGRRWESGDPLRVFFVVHGGTLLLNLDRNGGLSIEPGSTDHELLQ